MMNFAVERLAGTAFLRKIPCNNNSCTILIFSSSAETINLIFVRICMSDIITNIEFSGLLFTIHQQLFKIRCGQRRTEQISLHCIALVAPEKIFFSFRLHSFGNYLKTETVSHFNNSFHNCCICATVGDVANKTAVDFQSIEGVLRQIA